MPHDTNHAAVKVAHLKSVLRKSAADLLATADLLQFVEGLAQRVPGAVPVESIDKLNSALVALLDRQHDLKDTFTTLLAQTSAGKHGAEVNRLFALFVTFMHAQQTSTQHDSEIKQ